MVVTLLMPLVQISEMGAGHVHVGRSGTEMGLHAWTRTSVPRLQPSAPILTLIRTASTGIMVTLVRVLPVT